MATTSIGAPGVTFPDASVQSTANTVTNVPILQVYTTPGTWTKPSTVKAIKVTVVGSGGTGGRNPVPGTPLAGGGGGGGGGSVRNYPAPSLPGPQPYTVGAAVTQSGTNGASGNSSSFGVAPVTVITGTGGSGGGPGGGGGGSGSGGNLNADGVNGGYLIQIVPQLLSKDGVGGGTLLGGIGRGGNGQANGVVGTVIVEEFY